MSKTKIPWADVVWNPVTGCTKISAGCQNCYAERMANTRLRGRYGYPADDPFRVTLHPDKLDEPLGWKKPKKVFLCSMGDLFHPDVPFEYIRRVFYRIHNEKAKQHTFMLLTKRPDRMAKFIKEFSSWIKPPEEERKEHFKEDYKNLWLGATAENQKVANERIPILLNIPAAKRFVSVEPMLGVMNIRKFIGPYDCFSCGYVGYKYKIKNSTENMKCPKCGTEERDGFGFLKNNPHKNTLDWVICGAETGPGARYMDIQWARFLRDQCETSDIPFFFKKMSNGAPIPEDLQVREWPE